MIGSILDDIKTVAAEHFQLSVKNDRHIFKKYMILFFNDMLNIGTFYDTNV